MLKSLQNGKYENAILNNNVNFLKDPNFLRKKQVGEIEKLNVP